MSVREYLNEHLTPKLPPSWIFYDYDRSLGAIGKTTALLQHQTVEPGPEQGSLFHTVVLVVIEPTQIEKSFDDRLDDRLEDLIPSFQSIPALEFVRAEKGAYPADNPTYPAWSIQLRIKTT